MEAVERLVVSMEEEEKAEALEKAGKGVVHSP